MPSDPTPTHALRAEVSRAALRHNLSLIRQRAGAAEVLAVVKADAYGHGIRTVVPICLAEGVERFAVATMREALDLRQSVAPEAVPLLVLGVPLDRQLAEYEAHRLGAVVSSPEVADRIAASPHRPAELHVKVDTGMHRLGVAPPDVPDVLARLRDAGREVTGLWTHFATADGSDTSFVDEQTQRFQAVLDAVGDLAPPLIHVQNGPAAVRELGALRLPARSCALVRAGGVLYGLPSDDALAASMGDFRPAMRLVSEVVHLQTVVPGETVSYGRTWRAERPTLIATLAAGYADGVPRALSNRGEVGIRGQRWPVAGRVCMDMMMVDLGDPGGPGGGIALGAPAVLWGPGGPSASEAARAADTMAYELAAGLTHRVSHLSVSDFLGPGA